MKLVGGVRLFTLLLIAIALVAALAALTNRERFDLLFDEWAAARDANHIAALQASRSAGDLATIQTLAEAGDPEAQFVLAKAHCSLGEFDLATRWLDEAAEQGHYAAMHLRIVLSAPRGTVLGDPATAARWRDTLSRHDAPGLRSVEPLLSEECVPPELRADTEYYLEAVVAADLPYAFSSLGSSHELGGDIERNLVEAYALILVARGKVDSSSRDYRERLTQRLVELEQLLTDAEIQTAQRRANEWRRL